MVIEALSPLPDEREPLTDANFLLYAARNYDNPQCYDIVEFDEDLKRFKYIKRLLNKYVDSGELKERLILNHIISLNNVFGPRALARMMFFKMENYEGLVAPFLHSLGLLPDEINGIGINNISFKKEEIEMDEFIVERLSRV